MIGVVVVAGLPFVFGANSRDDDPEGVEIKTGVAEGNVARAEPEGRG